MRRSLAPSAMASSAAAKVEFHLKVPVRNKPSESLIKKAAVPLEAVASGADKQIRVRTMRHDKCIDSGHDKFDEMVSKFLADIGETQHHRHPHHQLRALRRADAKGDDGLRAGDVSIAVDSRLARLDLPDCAPLLSPHESSVHFSAFAGRGRDAAAVPLARAAVLYAGRRLVLRALRREGRLEAPPRQGSTGRGGAGVHQQKLFHRRSTRRTASCACGRCPITRRARISHRPLPRTSRQGRGGIQRLSGHHRKISAQRQLRGSAVAAIRNRQPFFGRRIFPALGHLPLYPSMDETAKLYGKIVNNGPYSDVAPHAQLQHRRGARKAKKLSRRR